MNNSSNKKLSKEVLPSSGEKLKLGKEAVASFFQEIKPNHTNEQELLDIIFELLCDKRINFLRFTKNENLSLPVEKK